MLLPLAAAPLLLAAGGEKVELPSNLKPVTIVASSTRAGAKLDAYAAWKILDGNAETVWCEGKPGSGSGETITLTFPEAVRVDEISLVTGLQATPDLFDANNVPSTITVKMDDGRVIEGMDSSLTEGAFDYTGTMSMDVGGDAFKLVIELGTIEKVTKDNHTCIADLRIRSGADDLEPLIGVEKAAIAALPDALSGLVAAFGACNQPKLADRVQFPLPFDFLQAVPPSAENGFRQGAKPVRMTWRASTDLAARCAAKDPGAPSVGETEIDGLVYTARSAGPGEINFRVDTREGEQDTWRLAWKDRRWKLVGVSRIPE
jgi:hypothetical protein